jgi:signal transduction histidine kinase
MADKVLAPAELSDIERVRKRNQELVEENYLLRDACHRQEEMDRLKTEFFANMSHELRTPLNAIIGFAQVLLKGIDGPLTDTQRTDLTAIYSSGQHLLALVNDMLDLSKIEAGKMELFQEWLDFNEITAGIMTSAIALIGTKDIELIENIPDNLPKVYADRLRVRQVVLNLVSNAAKFTEKGSIVLRAREESPDWLVVSVEDTGVGIAIEDLQIIFDHYRQADNLNPRRTEGTGLGLSISKKLIEMHGGRMWVKSRLNRGSTFYFTLPLTINSPQ